MSRRRHTGPQGRQRFARNGAAGKWLPWIRRILTMGALAAVILAGNAASALAAAATTTSTTSVVNPGSGTAPPGSEHLTTILSYLAWGVTALCVAGVFIVAGKMAVSMRGHSGGAEHAGALMCVLIAAVLAGSASAFITAVS
jgi:hypothetical protein